MSITSADIKTTQEKHFFHRHVELQDFLNRSLLFYAQTLAFLSENFRKIEVIFHSAHQQPKVLVLFYTQIYKAIGTIQDVTNSKQWVESIDKALEEFLQIPELLSLVGKTIPARHNSAVYSTLQSAQGPTQAFVIKSKTTTIQFKDFNEVKDVFKGPIDILNNELLKTQHFTNVSNFLKLYLLRQITYYSNIMGKEKSIIPNHLNCKDHNSLKNLIEPYFKTCDPILSGNAHKIINNVCGLLDVESDPNQLAGASILELFVGRDLLLNSNTAGTLTAKTLSEPLSPIVVSFILVISKHYAVRLITKDYTHAVLEKEPPVPSELISALLTTLKPINANKGTINCVNVAYAVDQAVANLFTRKEASSNTAPVTTAQGNLAFIPRQNGDLASQDPRMLSRFSTPIVKTIFDLTDKDNDNERIVYDLTDDTNQVVQACVFKQAIAYGPDENLRAELYKLPRRADGSTQGFIKYDRAIGSGHIANFIVYKSHVIFLDAQPDPVLIQAEPFLHFNKKVYFACSLPGLSLGSPLALNIPQVKKEPLENENLNENKEKSERSKISSGSLSAAATQVSSSQIGSSTNISCNTFTQMQKLKALQVRLSQVFKKQSQALFQQQKDKTMIFNLQPSTHNDTSTHEAASEAAENLKKRQKPVTLETTGQKSSFKVKSEPGTSQDPNSGDPAELKQQSELPLADMPSSVEVAIQQNSISWLSSNDFWTHHFTLEGCSNYLILATKQSLATVTLIYSKFPGLLGVLCSQGKSATYWANQSKHSEKVEVIKFLLDAYKEQERFLRALEVGSFEDIQFLLTINPDLIKIYNLFDPASKENVLFYFLRKTTLKEPSKVKEIVTFLSSQVALSLQAEDAYGQNILAYAILGGHTALVDQLLAQNQNWIMGFFNIQQKPVTKIFHYIALAIKGNHFPLVQRFVDKNFHPGLLTESDANNNTLLMLAAYQLRTDMVDLLLSKYADPLSAILSSQNGTLSLLTVACQGAATKRNSTLELNAIKAFFEAKIKPVVDAFLNALKGCNIQTLRQQLTQYPNLLRMIGCNDAAISPLIYLLENSPVVSKLKETYFFLLGAEPVLLTTPNKEGIMPIQVAIRQGLRDIVFGTFEQVPSIIDSQDFRILSTAAINNQIEMLMEFFRRNEGFVDKCATQSQDERISKILVLILKSPVLKLNTVKYLFEKMPFLLTKNDPNNPAQSIVECVRQVCTLSAEAPNIVAYLETLYQQTIADLQTAELAGSLQAQILALEAACAGADSIVTQLETQHRKDHWHILSLQESSLLQVPALEAVKTNGAPLPHTPTAHGSVQPSLENNQAVNPNLESESKNNGVKRSRKNRE